MTLLSIHLKSTVLDYSILIHFNVIVMSHNRSVGHDDTDQNSWWWCVTHHCQLFWSEDAREVVPVDMKNNASMCILINATYKRNDYQHKKFNIDW